jgi:hypothetical protein
MVGIVGVEAFELSLSCGPHVLSHAIGIKLVRLVYW